jgi:hypothetical protein
VTESRWYKVVMAMCALGVIQACAVETSGDDSVEATVSALSGSSNSGSGSSGSGSSGSGSSTNTEGDIFDSKGGVRKDLPTFASGVKAAQPPTGDIVDQAAAIRLGKALFWDQQTGTDGQVACASCHFHAGADNRRMNAVNPGGDGLFGSGGVTAAGQLYNGASVTNDDRVGSQGIARGSFVSIASDLTSAVDVCTASDSPLFGAQRQVTGRNTPSVIGAVVFRDNFWDGRANHAFNGLDPFGASGNSSNCRVWCCTSSRSTASSNSDRAVLALLGSSRAGV